MAQKVLSINRAALDAALEKILRNLKPTPKDPVFRQMVCILPQSARQVSLYASNESAFVLIRGVQADTLGITEYMAVEMVKFAQVVSADGDDVKIAIDSVKGKALVRVGKTSAQIPYITIDAYKEYVPNPDAYPEPDAGWVNVVDTNLLTTLAGVMLKCTNSAIDHMAGLWTDGEGTFVSSDRYRGMVARTTFAIGVEAVLPPSFFGLIGIMPTLATSVFFDDGRVWAKAEDESVVVSCNTLNAESFPARDLLVVVDGVREKSVGRVKVSSPALQDIMRRFAAFFGSADKRTVVRLILGNHLDVVGNNDNDDILKDTIVPLEVEGLERFDIKTYYNALDLLFSMFNDDVNIYTSGAPEDPLYVVAEDAGLEYFFASYYVPTEGDNADQ